MARLGAAVSIKEKDVQIKTFDLTRPTDYLDKLEWEFQRMMSAGEVPDRELNYHFLNFAVTAWHMADWTFPFISNEQKESLHLTCKQDLQSLLSRSSPHIKMCREIANASKHFKIDRSPNPTINTSSTNIQIRDGERPCVLTFWTVSLDGERYSIDEIASKCLLYWQCFLKSVGLGPGDSEI